MSASTGAGAPGGGGGGGDVALDATAGHIGEPSSMQNLSPGSFIAFLVSFTGFKSARVL